MKKLFLYPIYTLLLCVIVCACSDDLDIKQDYEFEVTHLPVQKTIKTNETVEIRLQFAREGNYEKAQYYIRYFQPDGKGELRLNNGTLLTPNDEFSLTGDNFYLYYTSKCDDQQSFEIYITDSFGKAQVLSFAFQHEKEPEPEPEIPVNYSFEFTTLPVVSRVLLNDMVEIRGTLSVSDERNDATYSIRYFQPSGSGRLLLGDIQMQPNELYDINKGDFRLYYVSDCEERQSIDIYVVDSSGRVVQKTFNFDNIPIEQEPEIDYSFVFETLPVPKAISIDETVEIRCIIKKADERNTTNYSIRYFQPDGKGELRFENGVQLMPNDLYSINISSFRLYYTSSSTVQQTIDIYIESSDGQVIQKTFIWQNEKIYEEGKTEDDTEAESEDIDE